MVTPTFALAQERTCSWSYLLSAPETAPQGTSMTVCGHFVFLYTPRSDIIGCMANIMSNVLRSVPAFHVVFCAPMTSIVMDGSSIHTVNNLDLLFGYSSS